MKLNEANVSVGHPEKDKKKRGATVSAKNKTKQDKTRQDRETRQSETRADKGRQDKPKHDKTRPHKAWRDNKKREREHSTKRR